MQAKDAEGHLSGALVKDANGRFAFVCKHAIVQVQLRGQPAPLRFVAHDHVAFRAAPQYLVVENTQDGMARQFPWEELEWMAAGEPEMADGSSLFQG
jgi:hypothetical protein